MAWDLPAVISNANDRTAAYFNKFMACFSVLAQHRHGGADGDGAKLNNHRITRYDFIEPMLFPKAGGQFNTYAGASITYPGVITNSPANNGDIGEWEIWLRKPITSYAFKIVFYQATDGGQIRVSLNGVSLGTVDTYNSVPGHFLFSATLTSSNIPSDGLYTFKVEIIGKNASSSGYKALLRYFYFRESGWS